MAIRITAAAWRQRTVVSEPYEGNRMCSQPGSSAWSPRGTPTFEANATRPMLALGEFPERQRELASASVFIRTEYLASGLIKCDDSLRSGSSRPSNRAAPSASSRGSEHSQFNSIQRCQRFSRNPERRLAHVWVVNGNDRQIGLGMREPGTCL
jgi:hypothetical protein